MREGRTDEGVGEKESVRERARVKESRERCTYIVLAI